MPNFRYLLRLTLAFISRFKAILLVGVVVGIAVFFSSRFLVPVIFQGSRLEKIGVTGRFRSDTLPLYILDFVGEGLTKMEEDGTVSPGLASSWNTPDKGKTWLFELKDNVFWQDGERVTSNSINYDFTDAVVERPNDKTLVFKLTNAYGAFPSLVARPTFKTGLLGTGEWKVTKLAVSGNFVQELHLANSNKEKKIYKFYPTEERTKLAFKLGQVDSLIGIYDPEPFGEWKTTVITPVAEKNKVAAIFLNSTDSLLSEKTFRQGLAYAIDKEALGGERSISPISPNSWAYNSQVKTYNYDVKRTQEILADLPEEDRNNLNIKLITSPTFLKTAEAVAQNWSDAGVKTEIQASVGIPTDYQAFLVIFDIPKDPDQYVLWHSTQTGTNISKYQNPRIDKLLEDGRLEVSLDTRKQIYFDFQRFLLEDSPAIFLYHPTSYTVTRK